MENSSSDAKSSKTLGRDRSTLDFRRGDHFSRGINVLADKGFGARSRHYVDAAWGYSIDCFEAGRSHFLGST